MTHSRAHRFHSAALPCPTTEVLQSTLTSTTQELQTTQARMAKLEASKEQLAEQLRKATDRLVSAGQAESDMAKLQAEVTQLRRRAERAEEAAHTAEADAAAARHSVHELHSQLEETKASVHAQTQLAHEWERYAAHWEDRGRTAEAQLDKLHA